jgi:hypothetical protein
VDVDGEYTGEEHIHVGTDDIVIYVDMGGASNEAIEGTGARGVVHVVS